MERLRQETLKGVEAAEKEAAINKARFDAQKAEEKRLSDEALKSWVGAKGILNAAIKEVNCKWTDTGVHFVADEIPDVAPMKASIGKVAISLMRPTLHFEINFYFLVYGTLDHQVVIEQAESRGAKRSIVQTTCSDGLTEERAEGLLGDLLLLNKRVQ